MGLRARALRRGCARALCRVQHMAAIHPSIHRPICLCLCRGLCACVCLCLCLRLFLCLDLSVAVGSNALASTGVHRRPPRVHRALHRAGAGVHLALHDEQWRAVCSLPRGTLRRRTQRCPRLTACQHLWRATPAPRAPSRECRRLRGDCAWCPIALHRAVASGGVAKRALHGVHIALHRADAAQTAQQ